MYVYIYIHICMCYICTYIYTYIYVYIYTYIMKLVAGPQESLTAPKGWLVDLEPQGK